MALLEAVLVSMVWASSFVIVKLVLTEIGPLTIGGLRYFLGFACLLPFLPHRRVILNRHQWIRVVFLGISAYTLGNGALFWSLRYLPATTASFLMSMISISVLLGGIIWLNEIPSRLQISGVTIAMVGITLFFSPGLRQGEPLGLVIFVLALIGFTAFALISRAEAIHRQLDTLTITALPLAIGGGLLLALAFFFEGIPRASLQTWGLVLLLSIINTALGYALYNHALQLLQAFEMNIILNLSPIWTALLGWLLLHEVLIGIQWAGIFVVMMGILLTQKQKKVLKV